MIEVDAALKPSMMSVGGFGTLFAAMVMVIRSVLPRFLLVGVRLRGHHPERAPLLHPRRALVAQQRAANFSGIVARRGADDLKTLGMLVAAELVLQKIRHAVRDRLADMVLRGGANIYPA